MASDAVTVPRRHFGKMLMAAPFVATACAGANGAGTKPRRDGFAYQPGIVGKDRLVAPVGRQIRVAFAINPGVQVIDVAGPWETFQDTYTAADAQEAAFRMYTVSETLEPVRGSGGLMITPQFTVETAPAPDLIVVPHFDRPSPFTGEMSAIHRWIIDSHRAAALTMSICTGAFQLAKTGLLDGIPMTTNQRASDNFARSFPHVDLRRGPRFVEAGRIATSGGLSAGIDLALRVVTRYFGDGIAEQTADIMEYAGTGWRA